MDGLPLKRLIAVESLPYVPVVEDLSLGVWPQAVHPGRQVYKIALLGKGHAGLCNCKTYSVMIIVMLVETLLHTDNVIGVHQVRQLVVSIFPVQMAPQENVSPERDPGTLLNILILFRSGEGHSSKEQDRDGQPESSHQEELWPTWVCNQKAAAGSNCTN